MMVLFWLDDCHHNTRAFNFAAYWLFFHAVRILKYFELEILMHLVLTWYYQVWTRKISDKDSILETYHWSMETGTNWLQVTRN